MTVALPDSEQVWEQWHPGEKCPGSATPLPGKCGSKLTSKRVREVGITRYCTRAAGHGTDHLGAGTCKYHLGNTIQHVRGASTALARQEIRSIAERLGEPEPMGHPEVEAWLLMAKAKQWATILENKMDEIGGLAVTDKAGIEHAKAIVDLLGLAWDRLQAMLEFSLKYDLRKRIVELEEHQATNVGAAFMAVMLAPSLGLTSDQIATARSLFSAEMNKLGPDVEPSWTRGTIIDAEVVED